MAQSFIPRQMRARPLATFAILYLIGIIVAWHWRVPIWLICCGAALCVALFCLRLRARRSVAAAFLLLAVVLGAGRMLLAVDALPVLDHTEYSALITGRIVSEPWKNPTTGRVIAQFQLETVNDAPSGMRVRLYLRGDDEALSGIDYGQRLRLTGHIWKCDPVTNPYEFDFGQYLARDGMSAYATAKIEDVEILDARSDLTAWMISARRSLSARLDALFPRSAQLVRALLLGDRSMLGDEMRNALSKSGTAHLISISGLHVTVLAMLLTLALRPFMTRSKAAMLSLFLLTAYGALAGFRAPYVRALVMFAIYSAAPLAGSPNDSITRLCVAMLIWLTIKPMDVLDAGFVLSYGACAGLILLDPPINHLLGIDRLLHNRWRKPLPVRAAGYFASLLSASLSAQLATLPAVIAFFGVQPVASLPFNLICVPLCMAGYLLSLIATIASAVSMSFAALLAQVPDSLMHALMQITQSVDQLPVAVVRIGRYPVVLILLHCALVLAASEMSRIPKRLRRFMPLALLAIAGLSSLAAFARAFPFSVTFLDAGQADCAIICTRGRTYMMDAGDTYTPAEDYLSATCLHLDGVILSHPHQDHVGGLEDVLSLFTPDVIYVPKGWWDAEITSQAVRRILDQINELGIPVVELSAGDSVALSDDTSLTVYSPTDSSTPRETNDLSMLALVEHSGHSVLFTGDLSEAGEPELIPDTQVLKVAHHGSDKATSQRFLDACTPGIAIISVGENNFGHPSDITLDKLDRLGAEVHLTRDCGAIRLSPKGDGWQIETYLEAHP